MASEEEAELAAALPGYDIEGELGQGAFGVVLAGRHRQLGRQVAIKRLPRAFSDHVEVRRRFSAEAKILASLDHPHIVPIFDYVEQGGLCVLVMELLPGGTVRQRQAEGLNSQTACAIALATSSALDYAHQRGVLHRDVKPDNLLFTGAGLLKVTDFGIAKVVGDVAVTQIGETLGTPLYMAPEQCLNQPLSPATDVYAAGVMLYELLAGEHPFAGSGDIVSTMYRQINEDARPLRAVNHSLPVTLEPVVMRAMAKDPGRRYRSARAFGGALAEAASAAWGTTWPSGDAVRIMSVGPIEAATGWPLTGPIDLDSYGPESAGTRETIRAGGLPTGSPPPLRPTVLRIDAPAPGGPPPTQPPPAQAPPWPPGEPAPPATPPGTPSWPLPQPAAPWPPAPQGPVPTEGLPYPSTAQTALQYPPDEPPIGAPRPPPTGRSRAVGPVMAAIAAVVIIAIAAVVILTRSHRGPSTVTTATTVTSATAGTSADQVAAALNGLIQQSAAARNQVVSTVASIQNCSADDQAASSALAAAVTTRQQVVKSLAGMPIEVLPNGTAMRLAMTKALNDSIDADHHFEAWLAGITGAGGCHGQAPHDANWSAAQSSSNAATGAKQTFAALWNPVATKYRLPQVSSATI